MKTAIVFLSLFVSGVCWATPDEVHYSISGDGAKSVYDNLKVKEENSRAAPFRFYKFGYDLKCYREESEDAAHTNTYTCFFTYLKSNGAVVNPM